MRIKKYIPSLFTLGNISCGFLAIASNDLFLGTIFILTGMFLDTMDGTCARAFNAQSRMGKELDSLSDMVTFGVAPAILYLQLSPVDHWVKYLAPLLFVFGAALRLAKFNILPPSKEFIGLSTPVATIFLTGIFIGVNYNSGFMIDNMEKTLVYFFVPLILMFLMMSNIKMFSLKGLTDAETSSILPLTCFLTFIALLFIDYRIALSANVIVYVVLSIISNIRTN